MTWTYAQFPQGDLTSDKDENLAAILSAIEDHKAGLSLDTKEVFRMPSSMFIYNLEWQTDVSISMGRSHKLFGMLNLPPSTTDVNKRMFWVFDLDY